MIVELLAEKIKCGNLAPSHHSKRHGSVALGVLQYLRAQELLYIGLLSFLAVSE